MTQSGDLLRLQELDLEIIRAQKRLEELPEKAAILAARSKLREIDDMASKASLLVRKLEAEVKARQDETATLVERIAGEQTKIMETTDHRQVQALTREMDGLRRRVDKLEMETMQFLERIDKAAEQSATIASARDTLAAKEAALVDRFKAVGGALQSQIVEMEARRAKSCGTLDGDLVARYESIRAGRGGIGVGRLDGETCTACHMTLPAERIRDLQSSEGIGLCPQCRRLLVVKGFEGE